ncbi:ankyrin protein [Fusarium pseudocircinatum]|uniref:Ankyrin protein n=1 Tax=Fusarium pseudocircinatum TaxID=56676 RepID=A0A8H5KP45_9HYPO|nr:ankyrin protein [Fusarium pseudocircinatum]
MPQGQSNADDAVGQKRKANEDLDQATAKKAKSRDALTHNDYTVGWICALPKELTASITMLDEKHPGLPKPPTDSNAYTLGSIGGHNIVMACLPKGITGNVSAATVARNMANTFPSIKIGLMVGIGGGVPSNKVRLGDVVVSTPTSTFAGVVKWDNGKHHDNKDDFERTGALDHPPQSLLTALTLLEAQQNLEGTKIPTYLEEVKKKWPMLASKFLRNDTLKDVLFKASYSHVKKSTLGGEAGRQESEDEDEDEEHESCHLCDKSMTVKRPPRDMVVHYGLIASGDGLIKGATARNKLNKDLGGHVLCIEMEAAGVMNHFPCLVIRGICDYADSHKNKDWQEHAAIVAAAFAKELLQHVQADDIQRERPIKDIIQDVHSVVSETREDVRQIKSMHIDSHKAHILNWLTKTDYASEQSKFKNQRQCGTANWFLEAEEFRTWIATCGQTLFCPGIPGAGKTILTSTVIDHIESASKDDISIGLAYIYCNFQRYDLQNPHELLSIILKQLVAKLPSLPVDINSLYASHTERGKRPERQDIFNALQNVVAQHSKVYLIVDALDEYGPSGSSRESFLSLLRELQRRHKINVLMTSRFDMRIIAEIDNIFRNVMELEILGATEDIARSLKDDIIKKISESAKGMFLLAQIYLKLLSYKTSETEMRRQLTAFQKHGNEDGIADALTQAYKETMDRINQQQPDHIILAKKVLFWIARAKRELTVQELQHALAMSSVQCEPCEADLPFDETLVTVCAGLVAVDEAKKTIQLVHYTVQEYLNQRPCQLLPVTELDIARACLAYLSFSSFEGGYYGSWYGMEHRLRSYPFYHYAAKNWGHHARDSSISVDELIEHFSPGTQLMKSVCVLLVRESPISYPRPRSTSRLHIAAYFGLENIVQKLLLTCSQADPTDDTNRTPLSYAAEQGHETVIKLLIDNGADRDSRGTGKYQHEGRTPISFAAEKGHEAAVRTLINREACLHLACGTKFGRGWTPLSYATRCGHKAIVTLLLESGAELEYDNSGRTALSHAAEKGHKDIVSFLLQQSADPDLRMTCSEEFGRTALSFAAQNGYQDIVQLLLNASTNELDSTDGSGISPLSYASNGGHETIVSLLLEHGANPNPQPRPIESIWSLWLPDTPLSCAASNGHDAIVHLLLEAGTNVDSGHERTPLSFAAEKGRESIVQLLLKSGATVDSGRERTPLSFAAEKGRESIVQLLLKSGATVDSGRERTPLSFAAEKGHSSIVRLLIEMGADADSKATGRLFKKGRTPLSLAAEEGHSSVVQLLLDARVDIDSKVTESKDYEGRTALSFAAGKGHKDIVRVLLEKGANPNSESMGSDSYVKSPMSFAASGGYEAIIGLLLEFGGDPCVGGATPLLLASRHGRKGTAKLLIDTGRVQIDLPDDMGRTPLSYMARWGHETLVRLLLDQGAELESRSNNHDVFGRKCSEGRTPLSFASEHGHPSVVELLLQRGAIVDSRTECDNRERSGMTPLSYAARNGHLDVIRMLLHKWNAESDAADGIGRTPLSYAAESGHAGIVQELVKTGANLETRSTRGGQTPLHFAARSKDCETIRVLVESGADVNSEDDEGRTAFFWPMQPMPFRNTKIIGILQGGNAEKRAADVKH